MTSSDAATAPAVASTTPPAEPHAFASLLFDGHPSGAETREQPAYFPDLNLDKVVDAVCEGREDYDLAPFFHATAPDLGTVAYRHEVFRDLQGEHLAADVRRFAVQLREMRARLASAEKLRYRYQKEGLFLDAVAAYCDAAAALHDDLAAATLRSRGLTAFRTYLLGYVASEAFQSLLAETRQRREDLHQVVYNVNVHGSRIVVSRYDGEADYSAAIEETFARFQQGAVKDYRVGFPDFLEMNHVEARISELVAQLFPEVFEPLDRFCEEHLDFLDPTVAVFDREVQFYLGYLDHLAPLQAAGLSFAFPEVTDQSKEIFANDAFDLALAGKLAPRGGTVVCNDFYLQGAERIFVVSGPNQGGKTTFARTFGQLHHLAKLGCPVPGSSARLFFFDQLFTQFEQEEDLDNPSGRLENDLLRIHGMLQAATEKSIVVMNEVFSSTTLHDARFLGQQVLRTIVDLDLLCVYVSFIDELASMPKAVSMISTIVPDDPTERTFEVVRGPANGLAYALAIAEKHGVTYERLQARLTR